MEKPKKPDDEGKRLTMLRALNLLDTPPEERFDRFTRLAQRIFAVETAVVSLVDEDRQWFKSCQGLDATETPRDISFCGHAILGDETFLVPDATTDSRFADNPLVAGAPSIRFYAGHPLKAPDGSKLGTVCLIDRSPREAAEVDLELLADLTTMVEQELKLIAALTMDSLTDISNRRGFEAIGELSLAICRRNGKPASLLFFDLDHFKDINDRLGHAVGDQVLKDMAEALRTAFRDSDVVARLGGDEFAVLLTGTSAGDTAVCLERLQRVVDERNEKLPDEQTLAYSVGVTEYDKTQHATFTDVLDDADKRMYEHKTSRRTRSDSSLPADR